MNATSSFERNQKDLFLADAQVVWAGQRVMLMDGNRLLADISAGDGIVGKIKSWCVKNSYRCSAVRDNKVWL